MVKSIGSVYLTWGKKIKKKISFGSSIFFHFCSKYFNGKIEKIEFKVKILITERIAFTIILEFLRNFNFSVKKFKIKDITIFQKINN